MRPGTPTTDSDAVRARRLVEIADRAHVDPDQLLDLVAEGLARAESLGTSEDFSGEELDLLREGNVDLSGPPAQERTAQAVTAVSAQLLNTTMSVEEAASLLGKRKDIVIGRLHQRRLAGIRCLGEWRVARWQFTDEGRPLPHLAEVLRHLGSLHPLAVANWMTTPDPDLVVGDRTLSPRQWLATGGPPGRVLDLVTDLPAAS